MATRALMVLRMVDVARPLPHRRSTGRLRCYFRTSRAIAPDGIGVLHGCLVALPPSGADILQSGVAIEPERRLGDPELLGQPARVPAVGARCSSLPGPHCPLVHTDTSCHGRQRECRGHDRCPLQPNGPDLGTPSACHRYSVTGRLESETAGLTALEGQVIMKNRVFYIENNRTD